MIKFLLTALIQELGEWALAIFIVALLAGAVAGLYYFTGDATFVILAGLFIVSLSVCSIFRKAKRMQRDAENRRASPWQK